MKNAPSPEVFDEITALAFQWHLTQSSSAVSKIGQTTKPVHVDCYTAALSVGVRLYWHYAKLILTFIVRGVSNFTLSSQIKNGSKLPLRTQS